MAARQRSPKRRTRFLPQSDTVGAIRRFNRFYTRRIGVLDEGMLHSPWSLTEVRVMYELAHRTESTAADLVAALGLDAGYLSRILRGFEREKLVTRKRSANDARQVHLALTPRGRRVFSALDKRQSMEVRGMIHGMPFEARRDLEVTMRKIERLLSCDPAEPRRVSFRTHRPGDIGWVVYRHGVIYWQEYGWDERFEAVVGEIAVRFLRTFDRSSERCWIAEVDGERAGCVFLVRQSRRVAKLRLLLVEPDARGLGIGGSLVDRCIAFAGKAGYRKLTLWTNSVLDAARHIYQERGFRLVREAKHRTFGRGLIGQYWELDLC